MLAHVGVEGLEDLPHVTQLPGEHGGRGDEADAAEGDDAVQPLGDPNRRISDASSRWLPKSRLTS